MRLVRAGPMSSIDNETNIGSFMIVEAATIAAVRRLHDGDPFTKVGLFERAEICGWDQHIGI